MTIVDLMMSYLERLLLIKKNFNQNFELTTILLGYSPSAKELSYCPSQHILGYKQRTNKQWKAMFGKWQQWIPYTSFNPTICFSRLRTWNIRVDRDPGAWEDCYKTTPHDIPDWSTVRKVGTMIRCQRAVVDGRDGAGINKGSLNKVVDKNEKQHFKERCEKGQANVGLMWQKAHRNVDVWPIRQPYRRALQINKRHISAKVKSHQVEIMISKLPIRPQEFFLFRRWLRWSRVPNHHFQRCL